MNASPEPVRVILALAQDYVRESFAQALATYGGGTVTHSLTDSTTALERVVEDRPHVVIVSADLSPLDGYAMVQEINARAPGVSTLLVAVDPTPADYRRALRAGARDMLQLPGGKKELFAALDAAAQVSGAKRSALEDLTARANEDQCQKIARRIVVFSTKGGTGKTFLATNLAGGLAASGKRVALVDLDLQFGDVAIALGMVPKRTIYDLIQTYPEVDLTLLSDFMLTHTATGIHVLPAPLYPEEGDRITADDIRSVLEAAQQGYDFVVVDTPPFFEERVLTALDWADDILLVGSLDVATLKSLKLTLSSMDLMAFPDEKIRVVMNRADSKVGLDLAAADRHLGRATRYSIPSSVDVPRALNAGEVISVQNPGARVSRELARITADYAGGANGTKRGRFGRAKDSSG
ncbi:MAG: AAA family ATPase [Thermoleophilia bacterium]